MFFAGMRNSRGFTLVEILVVAVLMGIIGSAIMGLFITSQRTAVEQLDVTSVQANLRIAMDRITSDIRMAGFLVNTDPVDPLTPPATTTDTITLRTAAVTGQYARIASDLTAIGSDTLSVAFPEMAQSFAPGNLVRIIRPPLLFQPDGDKTFTVDAVGAGTVTISGLNPGVEIRSGDILVGTRPGIGLVNVISYFRSGDTLIRRVQGEPDRPIVDNIASVQFTYQPDSEGRVQSVSVELIGSTDALPGASAKLRRLVSQVTVRNL